MNPLNSIPPTILLTIDVEDWFQVENLRPWFPPQTWDEQELRVEKNTFNLLDLFDSIELKRNSTDPINSKNPPDSANPKATFFILGWVAQRLPNLVREIQKRGHEVASHGYNHIMCNLLNPRELEQDLIRSKKTLEDIIGTEVNGYRAPNFSINDSLLKVLQANGFNYDSSYNNFGRHGRYGKITVNGIDQKHGAIKVLSNLHELPISNIAIAKQIIPWGGGGYFRFTPFSIFKSGIEHILNRSHIYNFYMHPWEIDPGQPRIKNASGLAGWRHYLNLDKTRLRLIRLLETFKHCRFPTCSQFLNEFGNQQP